MTKRWIAVAGVASLAGCTVGPNYRPPQLAVPVAFAGAQPATQSVDVAKWWTAFGDPVLDSLVERALVGNPDMATAASRVRQARLDEIAARSAGLPSVNASGNVNHVEFSKNAGLSSLARAFSGGSGSGGGGSGTIGGVALPGSGITTFAAGFDASWEVDLFGGVRRSREAAAARVEAAEWTRADAAVTLAAEVAQAYFALRLDQAQSAVIESEIARQRRALEIAGHVAQVGLVPSVDVTRQRSQLTTTEARAEPVRADADVRVHALGLLIGEAPETLRAELAGTPAAGMLPSVPAGLPSDLLRRRPDVRAAERRLAAANADIGVATADLYPRFSLTGIAQLISTSLASLIERDSLQVTGTGGVSIPIVDFGRRRATVESRREDREQAWLEYQATVLGSLRDVEDALSRLDAEHRRNAALARAVVDAEASARAVEAQYRTGFVAENDLLNVQVQVLSARERKEASDAMLRQTTAMLFKAMGGGWSDGRPLPARPDR